jgi:uncharacterized lipoprotein YmbA
MKKTPSVHRLSIIAVMGIILLSGCLGRSPSTRFYALTPMLQGQATSLTEIPGRNPSVGIGPVKLADYLDQSKLVTRTGENRVDVADYDQWAGSLGDNFSNVLAENIGLLLPTDQIHIFPWRSSVPIDFQVLVDVFRFDGRLGEEAQLVARWSVFEGRENKLLSVNRSSIREPVQGPDYNALVAAESRALAKLSQEIVAAIQAVGRKQPGK